MKKLLCLMGGALLLLNGQAQQIKFSPFYIGERVPDLPLNHIINYNDSTATFSSFGHKLLILDFWDITCTTCIAMFPKEDSIQQALQKDVQFVLVTYNGRKKVEKFITHWESTHNTHLQMPVVTDDKLLHKLFRFHYIPHYVWLAPNGNILAQTSEININKAAILEAVRWLKEDEQRLKTDNLSADYFRYQKPSVNIDEILKAVRVE